MSQYGSPGITAQILQQQQSLPMTNGADVNNISSNINAMAAMGQFEQTFNNVPQDLWKMPMTLEWDWADMTGGFSSYEDGISTGHGTSEFNQSAMNGGRR
jgi:hypothetical protein